jgi:hypothetical protein
MRWIGHQESIQNPRVAHALPVKSVKSYRDFWQQNQVTPGVLPKLGVAISAYDGACGL